MAVGGLARRVAQARPHRSRVDRGGRCGRAAADGGGRCLCRRRAVASSRPWTDAGRRGGMMPQRTPRLPWTVGQLLFWLAASTGGLILLLVSWWLSSGQPRLGSQIPWLNAAIAGLAVAGAGNLLWLLQGRRVVAERTRAVADRLVDRPPPRRRAPPARPPPPRSALL